DEPRSETRIRQSSGDLPLESFNRIFVLSLCTSPRSGVHPTRSRYTGGGYMKRLIVSLILCVKWLPGQNQEDLKKEVAALRALVQQWQARVDRLEGRSATTPAAAPTASAAVVAPQAPQASTAAPPVLSNLLAGSSINFLLDTYYGYNFNHPIGRV